MCSILVIRNGMKSAEFTFTKCLHLMSVAINVGQLFMTAFDISNFSDHLSAIANEMVWQATPDRPAATCGSLQNVGNM